MYFESYMHNVKSLYYAGYLIDSIPDGIRLQVRITLMDLQTIVAGQLHSNFRRYTLIGQLRRESMS